MKIHVINEHYHSDFWALQVYLSRRLWVIQIGARKWGFQYR